MPIVEVKIANNILLLPCTESDTVGVIAQAAFQEYEKSFLAASTPARIVVIKDSKQRILSTSINIFEAGLDKYIEVTLEHSEIADDVNESELRTGYEKWQLYFVRRCHSILDALASKDSLATPSSDILRLLSELQHAHSEAVVEIVVQCYSLLLRRFRSKQTSSAISNHLLHIFKHTPHENIALASLQLMKYSPFHPSDLLQEVLAKISYFSTEASRTSLIQASLLQTYEEFKFQYENSKATLHTLSTSPITTAASGATPSVNTGGMSLSRIIELLKSNDSRCRKFALEKLQPSASSNSTSAGYLTSCSATSSVELMDALCSCLKQSLTTPTTVKASEGQPIAVSICRIALHSETSDISAVTTCLLHIQKILAAYPQTLSALTSRAKLLTTLLHCNSDEISSSCAAILKHCIEHSSWSTLDIQLDEVSLVFLLQRHHDVKLLALQYIKDMKNNQHNNMEQLLCYNNYAMLQNLWKTISTSGDLSLLALEILAEISAHNVVRSFLLKYGGVDKLLQVLSHSLLEYAAASSHSSNSLLRIQHSLKIITNLTSMNSSSMLASRVKTLLQGECGEILKEIAVVDDVVAFYFGMLSI